jgi:cytochrome c peroxidase
MKCSFLKIPLIAVFWFLLVFYFTQCQKPGNNDTVTFTDVAIKRVFGDNINIQNPYNYAQQSKPGYILANNGEVLDDKIATLGRVLFYDKNLSINNTIACASCHHQSFAFSDTAIQSKGVNGLTGRHSMRLINARFAREFKFFWDERAATLEIQTTQPIQDHAEMGYSGENGDPGISELLNKLNQLEYYKELVAWAFPKENKTLLTEAKLQECLSSFIRSIQSFDSKYDVGRAQLPLNANNAPLPNFSTDENAGLQLFMSPPQFNDSAVRISGGLGCGGCHRAPEFDIDPNTRNNGFVGNLSKPAQLDLFNTRSPTLRDLLNPSGNINGPMMHTGAVHSLEAAVGHYNRITIIPGNTNIDPRLTPRGIPQTLGITAKERQQVIAFLQALTGTSVYTEKKWSNPFL